MANSTHGSNDAVVTSDSEDDGQQGGTDRDAWWQWADGGYGCDAEAALERQFG